MRYNFDTYCQQIIEYSDFKFSGILSTKARFKIKPMCVDIDRCNQIYKGPVNTRNKIGPAR